MQSTYVQILSMLCPVLGKHSKGDWLVDYVSHIPHLLLLLIDKVDSILDVHWGDAFVSKKTIVFLDIGGKPK